jgi:hypothetical protein
MRATPDCIEESDLPTKQHSAHKTSTTARKMIDVSPVAPKADWPMRVNFRLGSKRAEQSDLSLAKQHSHRTSTDAIVGIVIPASVDGLSN